MGRPRTGQTPTRQCRVCRTKAPKRELERWVFAADGLILDTAQNQPGRGWYACHKSQCSRFVTQAITGQAKKRNQQVLTQGALS